MDDAALCVNIMNAMLFRRNRRPISLNFYREWFDLPVYRYYERLAFDPIEDPLKKISYEFIEAYERRRLECHLQPNTQLILEGLLRIGTTHSILSAYRQAYLDEIIAYFGLKGYFIRLIGQNNIYGEGKLEAGRAWLNELGIPPCQVLLIGDTVHDFSVASALGIDCILLSHGHHSLNRLRQCGVKVFSSFAQIASYLLRPL